MQLPNVFNISSNHFIWVLNWWHDAITATRIAIALCVVTTGKSSRPLSQKYKSNPLHFDADDDYFGNGTRKEFPMIFMQFFIKIQSTLAHVDYLCNGTRTEFPMIFMQFFINTENRISFSRRKPSNRKRLSLNKEKYSSQISTKCLSRHLLIRFPLVVV